MKTQRGRTQMKNKNFITPTKIANDAGLLTADGFIVSTLFCNPRLFALRLNK